MGTFSNCRFLHALFLTSLIFGGTSFASDWERTEIAALDPAKTWATLEIDIRVPPGETEIFFSSGSQGRPANMGRIAPPAHCKLTLQADSKTPRRINSSKKTALAIKSIKTTVASIQKQGVLLELDSKTFKTLECVNTTYGYSLSSGVRAFPPTFQDVSYHLGGRFSFRPGDTAAEDVVDP